MTLLLSIFCSVLEAGTKRAQNGSRLATSSSARRLRDEWGACQQRTSSPLKLFGTCSQMFSHTRLNRYTHTRNRMQVKRFLDSAPVFAGRQNRAAAFARNNDGFMCLVGLTNEAIKIRLSFASGQGLRKQIFQCSYWPPLKQYSSNLEIAKQQSLWPHQLWNSSR